jgi:ADP-ribose pyrophosphatase
MKIVNLCLVLILLSVKSFASNEKEAYFQYLEQYPKILGPLGDYSEGEIEIVTDLQKMAEIEKSTGRTVGVMAEDKYWIWLNDAVRFPSGTYGVYGRILWRQSLNGRTGVAVLPVLPNGKIALNRNYRHATRSWEYELPRGVVNGQETSHDAAAREVREETGMIVGELYPLGEMSPDSGVTITVVPIFFARVVEKKVSTPEESEAIAAVEAFSLAEIKEGFVKGYLQTEVDGEVIQVPLRDPFLSFALFQADIRSLFPKGMERKN